MNPTIGNKRPVALIILSGFGWSPDEQSNAIAKARTPFLDQYFSRYKSALLQASGEAVGLPPYQSGNSEISHLILGSGQTLPLDVRRIDEAIQTGAFFENPALISAIDSSKRHALHLIGLVSDGSVHSLNSHLYALLRMAAERGAENVFVHAFTDGRDTPPRSAKGFIAELSGKMRELGVGRIASLCGRYYAMDRDNRWDRIERAYRAMAEGKGEQSTDPMAAIDEAYEHGVADEFLEPVVFTHDDGTPLATIRSGDSVIFFNFRADRARQLTRAFTGLNFDRFERERIPDLHFATFTQYDRSVTTPIVFPPIALKGTLAEVFEQHGLKHMRIAETEKYAHVTYFFNAGIEKPFPGESRVMVPSPAVATYDLRPEMSAFKVTDKICRALDEGENDVYIINFANGDMVGHTGNLKAAIEAIEAVDLCLGWVIGTIERIKGAAIVTADHGNCELMTDPDTTHPHTAHTNNPVPLILCDPTYQGDLQKEGALGDVAPTLLALLGIEKPEEMTGQSLLI
jgi:2,3-bisphosphoglycerate-independent phosphoglycerate mutase